MRQCLRAARSLCSAALHSAATASAPASPRGGHAPPSPPPPPRGHGVRGPLLAVLGRPHGGAAGRRRCLGGVPGTSPWGLGAQEGSGRVRGIFLGSPPCAPWHHIAQDSFVHGDWLRAHPELETLLRQRFLVSDLALTGSIDSYNAQRAMTLLGDRSAGAGVTRVSAPGNFSLRQFTQHFKQARQGVPSLGFEAELAIVLPGFPGPGLFGTPRLARSSRVAAPSSWAATGRRYGATSSGPAW